VGIVSPHYGLALRATGGALLLLGVVLLGVWSAEQARRLGLGPYDPAADRSALVFLGVAFGCDVLLEALTPRAPQLALMCSLVVCVWAGRRFAASEDAMSRWISRLGPCEIRRYRRATARPYLAIWMMFGIGLLVRFVAPYLR
jgi:uncharacterized membrane protein YidH (DUF202 family)